jgi:acyl-CoA synthetase (NDP forming)
VSGARTTEEPRWPLASLASAARSSSKRVGVVTTTAGGATMVVDPLASRGVTIELASAATFARLTAAGVEVKPTRLIDLTIAGAQYETMKSTLDILLSAPEFDLVLAVIGSSARAQPEKTVKPLIDSAGAKKPLAAFLAPDAPQALAMLSRAGVPCFHTPEACADAIAAALARRAPRLPATLAAPKTPGDGDILDELAAGLLLDRLGIARAPALALDAAISHAPVLPFPYPVAVKVLSAAIAHKTDVGGVVLGVTDGEHLVAAIRRIAAEVAERKPGTKVERVLVQPMFSGLGEALVGYRVDRDVGPLVMVAAGGVLAEITRDRSLRMAPVDLEIAREMIAEVRSLVPLSGYRGKPKGDLDALAQAIVALSVLADDPSIAEAEINPLIVLPAGRGVVAVDALVKRAGKA